jgi:hypothetical protein
LFATKIIQIGDKTKEKDKKETSYTLYSIFFIIFVGKSRKTMDMTQRLKLPLGMMLLLMGGMTYLLFRPQTLLMFHVTDAIGLSAAINSMREGISSQLPEFIIYNLPCALWAAAYILTTEYFLYRQSVKTRILVAGIIPVIGAVSELLQLTGLLPGTFDVADLLCYLVPYLLYLSITLKIKRI